MEAGNLARITSTPISIFAEFRVTTSDSGELSALLGEIVETTRAELPGTPIYEWFEEGHDTLDLQDARALLERFR